MSNPEFAKSPNSAIVSDGLDPAAGLKKRKEQAKLYIKQEIGIRVVAGTLNIADDQHIAKLKQETADKYELSKSQMDYLYRNHIKQEIGELLPAIPIIMQSITKTQNIISKLETDIDSFDTKAQAASDDEGKIGFYNLKLRAVNTLNTTINNQVDTIKKMGGLELAKRKLDIAQDELNRRKGIFSQAPDQDEFNYQDMSKEDLESTFKERMQNKKHLLAKKKSVDFIDYKETK